jgi:hypothetical protein
MFASSSRNEATILKTQNPTTKTTGIPASPVKLDFLSPPL